MWVGVGRPDSATYSDFRDDDMRRCAAEFGCVVCHSRVISAGALCGKMWAYIRGFGSDICVMHWHGTNTDYSTGTSDETWIRLGIQIKNGACTFRIMITGAF